MREINWIIQLIIKTILKSQSELGNKRYKRHYCLMINFFRLVFTFFCVISLGYIEWVIDWVLTVIYIYKWVLFVKIIIWAVLYPPFFQMSPDLRSECGEGGCRFHTTTATEIVTMLKSYKLKLIVIRNFCQKTENR